MSDPSTSRTSPATEPGQFTLQVLSPSINVPQPLFFALPVTTTVRQLKERIRHSVGTRPPDDAQRLIHRGRLLARDSETMLELFGEELRRSTEHHTLHLVLRDLSEPQPQPAPTPQAPVSTSQHASSRSQTPGQQHPQQVPHQPHGQPFIRTGHPNIAFGFAQPPNQNGTQLPPGWSTQQLFQNQLQTMARLGVANPNQATGPNPAVHHGMHTRGVPGSTTPGRTGSPLQPETTRTVIREGIGPDGQRWRFTVNESIVTTSPRPGGTGSPFSSTEAPTPPTSQPRLVPGLVTVGGHDGQNPFRTADAGPGLRAMADAMADAMRRNTSSSSLPNLAHHQGQQPITPGVTTPLIPSRTGSAAGTPDPLRATGAFPASAASIHPTQASSSMPEVFILSSPSGPRAILLNGSSGTYYSPQLRSYQPTGLPLPLITPRNAVGSGQHGRHVALPQIVPRSPFGGGNPVIPQANAPPLGQQPQIQPQHELQVPGRMHAQFGHGMDNPQVQAIRLAQVWPHVWMIIRLALFVWWFTSPTSSWSRWFTVVSIAITLFIVNTGALNPLAEQIWVPLRRHLENLIPLAADAQGRQQQRPVAENDRDGDANIANPARPRDPDPLDAAARLVQQRREDNANWLLNQARRLERAGILFIASLAPGLAERHIAQVEEEARAERQRQQEAQAAATAAAQTGSEDANNNPATASPEARASSSEGEAQDNEPRPSAGATGQNTNTPAENTM
ncbi:hypothetical protein F5Y03DRAFT_347106 [Xylaria venustula]|nr:hypothetical protein F5Y03DRAFT_347106 [Xylaria venustula]